MTSPLRSYFAALGCRLTPEQEQEVIRLALRSADWRTFESESIRRTESEPDDSPPPSPVPPVRQDAAPTLTDAAGSGGGSVETWISHGVDGFELHETEAEALLAAYAELEMCRDQAPSDGWPEETDQIWWGRVEIRECVVETERRPWDSETDHGGPFDDWVDYALRPARGAP